MHKDRQACQTIWHFLEAWYNPVCSLCKVHIWWRNGKLGASMQSLMNNKKEDFPNHKSSFQRFLQTWQSASQSSSWHWKDLLNTHHIGMHLTIVWHFAAYYRCHTSGVAAKRINPTTIRTPWSIRGSLNGIAAAIRSSSKAVLSATTRFVVDAQGLPLKNFRDSWGP